MVALSGALVLTGLILLLLSRTAAVPSSAAGATDAGQSPTAGEAFEPVLGMPAMKVVVLGSAPTEARGEAWAYGSLGDVPATVNGTSYSDQLVLLEHTESSGWQIVPLPHGPNGETLRSTAEEGVPYPYLLGALGGRVTSAGGVALLTSGGIVLRDPGAQPILAPIPASDEVLAGNETLPPADPPSGASTPYAAIEEASGHTGVLIAPYRDGAGAEEPHPTVAGPGILRYDGKAWQREPISVPAEARSSFTPEALDCGGTLTQPDASSPGDCWLLAAYRVGTGSDLNRLSLFRRLHPAGVPSEYVWEQEKLVGWPLGEGAPPAGITASSGVVPLGAGSQMLTVTSQGVWVDFEMHAGTGSATTDISQLLLPSASQVASSSVAGTWCFGVTQPGCDYSLESSLPAQYRSFALPGSSPTDPGKRIITGLANGAMLELSGAGGFQYTIGPGGNSGGAFGAAFSFSGPGAVEQGFIGEGGPEAIDDEGQSQMIDVKPQPQGDQLVEEALPFRHPLLALAQAPGSTPGDPNADSIAVGVKGQVGRYTPSEGWSSESLYSSSGEVQTPTLRGVAWPEPNRAYAVGDKGAMWVWRAESGLWEPDPATPYNFIGNLTAVAFSSVDPGVGYAVGKQGVLLKYGKSWEEISAAERESLSRELKLDEERLNFTSIAFAGTEALVTYRTVTEDPKAGNRQVEAGGLIVEDGSGWHVDHDVAGLLAQLPDVRDTVLSKVAGLADGGAVAAGPGLVIEREAPAGKWRFSAQPLPEAQNVSALAAYRDGSDAIRTVVSVDLDSYMNPNFILGPAEGAFAGDLAPPASTGQPLPYLSPDPLPNTGYVLQETASGWKDIEHMALESPGGHDMPVRPDPVLALQVSLSGESGLAVGGQTDDATGSPPSPNSFETAAAMRFGTDDTVAGGNTTSQIVTNPASATFAVGGSAACEQACANFADELLAPDALLSHALQTANQIAAVSPSSLRGFLYTGGRLLANSQSLGAEAFERELARYAALLAGAGAPFPVRAAASPNDLSPSGGIAPFLKALAPFVPGSGNAYYSFLSEATTGGTVMVIVLDYSSGALGAPQQEWLRKQLEVAHEEGVAAIVMGNASLGFVLPEAIAGDPEPVQAEDAATVSKILVEGGASAYLFDYPGVNVQAEVSYGSSHIPAFGTGTLGYASPPGSLQTDSPGSSGFLLVEVNTSERNSVTNVAPVSGRVEPNIGKLALAATDGTLLRRSQVGLFEALARVPPSGRAISTTASGSVIVLGPQPYEPIPFNCQGPDCADHIPTEYTFASSKPDVGDFVAHEASSANPHQVELGPNKLPVPDPHSGLFCAYNEGTTTVSITTGGLTYSEPITVQGGSVQYPCGTVPLKNPPPLKAVQKQFEFPQSNPSSPKATPFVPAIHIPVPQPPVPVHHIVKKAKPPFYHFVYVPAQLVPVLAVVPPGLPTAIRPTPPSGTAQVPAQSPITEAVEQQEEEHEEAVQHVHHYAAYDHAPSSSLTSESPPFAAPAQTQPTMTAYSHPEEGPIPAWSLGLVLILGAAAVVFRPNGKEEEQVYVRESID